MGKKLIIGLLLLGNLFGVQIIELSGDKSYPPYSYLEKGTAKGVYVDVLNAAFDKIPDYEVKFNMVAWKRAIGSVKQGKTVGFFPPYYNDKRTAWTKFSEPMVSESTIIFAKESTLKDKTKFPKDFYGMKLCLNRGFAPSVMGGEKLEKTVKDGSIKLIEANDNKSCLSRVDRGIADFYLGDQLIDSSLFPMIKKGMNIKANSGYLGFTLKIKNYPFMGDLQKKFNQVIKDMKKSGELDSIVQKYK